MPFPVHASVLLVESEGISRCMMSEFLADGGYGVLEADDPSEGEKLFRSRGRVDLVVTSQGKNWPMKGTQFVQLLRRQQAALPAIIMTGGGPVPAADEMVVIHKPFSMASFLDVVARTLSGRYH